MKLLVRGYKTGKADPVFVREVDVVQPGDGLYNVPALGAQWITVLVVV